MLFAAKNEPLLLNNMGKYLNSLTISKDSLFKIKLKVLITAP